jgi:hypothetical protein
MFRANVNKYSLNTMNVPRTGIRMVKETRPDWPTLRNVDHGKAVATFLIAARDSIRLA